MMGVAGAAGAILMTAPRKSLLYMRTDRIVRARQHLLHQLSIDLYRRWSAGRDESTALRVCCEQAFHILYSVLFETPIFLGVNVSPASPLNIRKVPDGRSGGLACIYAMPCRAMPSWLGKPWFRCRPAFVSGFFCTAASSTDVSALTCTEIQPSAWHHPLDCHET